MVISQTCPTLVMTKESKVTPMTYKLVKVERTECKTCHSNLLLHNWNRTSRKVSAHVYVFYINGTTAVGVGGNAFWHLEDCRVNVGVQTVSGTLVEEGEGMSPYKVLKCS